MLPLFKILTKHSFIRFGITGVINTAVDFVVFFILYEFFSWAIIPANVLAFVVANMQSYLANKHWTFKTETTSKFNLREYFKFMSASIFSLIIGTSILVFGEPWLPILTLKIIAAIIGPAINYVMYRWIIFN